MKPLVIDEHIRLRFAEEKDAALVLEFIRGLAEYEHLMEMVTAGEASLKRYLFDERLVEVVIAEYDGVPAGFALFFYNFSTFLGKPGIYIEDLFVKPDFRGKGLGKRLLSFLARLALDRGCGRLEWACLNWNEPSIKFYQDQGARPLSEWTSYRLDGENLENLGSAGKF